MHSVLTVDWTFPVTSGSLWYQNMMHSTLSRLRQYVRLSLFALCLIAPVTSQTYVAALHQLNKTDQKVNEDSAKAKGKLHLRLMMLLYTSADPVLSCRLNKPVVIVSTGVHCMDRSGCYGPTNCSLPISTLPTTDGCSPSWWCCDWDHGLSSASGAITQGKTDRMSTADVCLTTAKQCWSDFNDFVSSNCPCRDAENRLLWRDKTCPAHH